MLQDMYEHQQACDLGRVGRRAHLRAQLAVGGLAEVNLGQRVIETLL